MIGEIIIENLIPFNSLNLLRRYLHRAAQIQLEHNRRLMLEIGFIILLLVLAIAHLYYVAYTPLSELEQIIHADVIRFLFPIEHMVHIMLGLIGMILFTDDYECFFVRPSHRGKSVLEKVRKASFDIEKSLLISSIPVIDLLILYFHIGLFIKTYAHADFFFGSFYGIACLSFQTCVLLLYDASFTFLSHILMVIGPYTMGGLFAMFMLTDQVSELLGRASHHFDWVIIDEFVRQNVGIVEIIRQANRASARLFLIYFIICVPINTYFLMLIVTGKVRGITALFIGTITAAQINVIINLHFFLSIYSKRFHQPAGLLLRLMARHSHRIGHFRSRFRMALVIDRLHTKRKYGITYGGYGLITLRSFSKFLLFYIEMLMYAYMIINDIH